MTEAFIVQALRSPVGRRNGSLSGTHPADLSAHVLKAIVEHSGVEPSAIDDVIFGCVGQVGPQAGNIARTAWLSAGLPEEVPGTTLDRQCGSSQQAVHFAAQAVQSGSQDLVIAGGVEVMSSVPIGSARSLGVNAGLGGPFDGIGWQKRYGHEVISQFHGAELIAEKWGIDRVTMEVFAFASHQRALNAWKNGYFDSEVVSIDSLSQDECPRADTTLEKLASLPPLSEGGRITAGLSSQISDGASVVLVASEKAIKTHHLTPLARIHTMAVVGSDPVLMLTGPIAATRRALQRANLDIADVGLFEVNEAFASVVLAWLADTGASSELTNVNGGAISLGHPLGATGTRLTTTLLHEMRRRGTRYGLQTMCEGGGMANATIFELI